MDGVSEENQVKLVPHSEIQMLGVPLGSDAFVSEYVDKKLLGRLSETVRKLMAFEDTQAAFYLLRVSFSVVRAVHFMRTTPLRQWQKQGQEFDALVHEASDHILGHPTDERTHAQAALTPKLGGLGLRKAVEHADFAYSASWHESKRQAGETWVKPEQVSATHVRQKEASYKFDEQMHKYLVDSAPNDREKQRLLRVAMPHAGTFLTAVPSAEDGLDCLLKPRVFRIAVAYRLGLPVLPNEIPCPSCMQPINKYGDHATCCAKNGDLIIRHNALRNLVCSIAADGLLNPVLEKKGILGPTSGRRPGDVSIPNWKNHNGLAIDIAVTSPLTKSSERLTSPCEEYARSQKHNKYDKSFKDTNFHFCAMVFETLGGINSEGEEVLRELFRFASKQLGVGFSSYCSRAWARVSCNLQRSIGQVILNRIDGSKPDAPGSVGESNEVPVGNCPEAACEREKVREKEIGGPLSREPLITSEPAVITGELMSRSESTVPSEPRESPPQNPRVPISLPFPIPSNGQTKSGVGGEVKSDRGGRDGEGGRGRERGGRGDIGLFSFLLPLK